jgi:hypothetical protein
VLGASQTFAGFRIFAFASRAISCRTSAVSQNQIIASFVRAATWQLMRRSPTWILILVVVIAWLFAGHH